MRWSPAAQAFRSILLGLAVIGVAPTVSAQPFIDPPAGWSIGNWIVAPYVELETAAEDNIFRRNASVGAGRVADRFTSLRGEVAATLPFRQSLMAVSASRC